MKKALRHAASTALPIVAAKATKEGRRFLALLKARYAEVHKEKGGEAQ